VSILGGTRNGRNKGRTSFLERNQLIIGVIGTLFVLGGSTLALALSSGVFKKTYLVEARFTDAAGIKSGDDVTVAGLDAGTVDSVEIEDGLVTVSMKVDDHVEMPADARAEIVVETLMGKKSVALEGGSTDEPLADGDTIPVERTRTPVELLDLANTSKPLLEESDAVAFQDFLNSITKITRGKEAEVGSLIRGLGDVTAVVDARSDELARLLESLNTLGATFAERDDTIVSLVDKLDVVLANLSDRQTEVVRLLEATDAASHEVADLVGRNRSRLDGTLSSLHTTLTTLERNQVDLAAGINYLEDAVEGYSSVGYSQGTPNRWANIFVQSLGPAGIDAFFGPCGAFDQALDDLLGPDPRPCNKRSEYGGPDEGEEEPEGPVGTTGPQTGGEAPETDEEEAPLPGDIGDIIGSVTGTPLPLDLRGGL
jgi:phospholipid/cholesterol/gamma-HCH transport system substrate-binding protein